MTDTLELQTVKGKLADLNLSPGETAIKIRLSRELVLYKDNSQIIGDERIVQADEDGNWEAELLETDNMSDEGHYIFNINGRIYQKFVPVDSHDWEFYDLPNALC